MKDTNKQPYSLQKRTVSIIVSAAIVATGIAATVKLSSKNKAQTPEITTEYTTLVDNINLLLTEDFNIEDAAAVKARAEAIFNLSDGDVSVEDIINLIYLTNSRYDLMTYNTTDKVEQLAIDQKLITRSMVDLLSGGQVYAYMLMAQDGPAKQEAIKLATIAEKQKEAIKSGDTSKSEEYANEIQTIINGLKDKNISDNDYFSILADFVTIQGLFPDHEFDNSLISTKSNAVFADDAASKGVDPSELLDKNLNCNVEVATTGNKYIKEDAADAKAKEESRVAQNGSAVETTIVKGGEEVGTVKETTPSNKNEVTTDSYTYTIVNTVPETKPEEKTEVVKGGEIVEEGTVVSGGEILESYTYQYDSKAITATETTSKFIDDSTAYTNSFVK